MFAVIYRTYLKPGREEAFRQLWHKVASYFVQHRGALGSTLHKAEEGYWVAYSRWPDRATRDASWSETETREGFPPHIVQIILELKDCKDDLRSLPEITMEIVDEVKKFPN